MCEADSVDNNPQSISQSGINEDPKQKEIIFPTYLFNKSKLIVLVRVFSMIIQ